MITEHEQIVEELSYLCKFIADTTVSDMTKVPASIRLLKAILPRDFYQNED